MRTTESRPPWMPEDNVIRAIQAGRWWDAIAVPQLLGLDALQVIDHHTGHAPGPVIWDHHGPRPRLYFLVPAGTAATWAVPDTEALGATTFVGVPGATILEPPGPHWLCPPDPDDALALVDPGGLAQALRAVLAAAS